MPDTHPHASHPAIVKRLKRAEGHLRHVTGMIETGASCLDIAHQLAAVESALSAAKRELIRDHIDYCLTAGDIGALAELKALARLL